MIFSYNLGIQAKPFIKSRFNPKPYATVGINPVNFRIHNETIGNTEKWYFSNGAFNYGLDFDIWLTDYFAVSLTYEMSMLSKTPTGMIKTLHANSMCFTHFAK